MKPRYLTAAALALAATCTTRALDIPGADGSDNAFAPTSNLEVDLGAADTGVWNGANPNPGEGVYDPEKWAVVFRFSSVNIPENVTVTFKNNASRAPVVFLVSGDVSIRGKLVLSARDLGTKLIEPGPGGFRGGPGEKGPGLSVGPGFGPGRDFRGGGPAGSYATPGYAAAADTVYGNAQIVPLIGGSGGYGWGDPRPGGAGGGAILIAAKGTIAVDGSIAADGGGGDSVNGGGGGAIRLIAEQVTGKGAVSARSQNGYSRFGGLGRIRIETSSFDNGLNLAPVTQPVAPDAPVLLWPKADAPSARIVSVVSKAAPSDPKGGLGTQAGGNSDIALDAPGNGEVVIETSNLPPSAKVILKATTLHGGGSDMPAIFISQQGNKATWRVGDIPFHLGYCTLQVVARAQ